MTAPRCRCRARTPSRRHDPRGVSPQSRYRVEFSDGRDLISLPYAGALDDARIGAFLEEQVDRNPGLAHPLGYGRAPPGRARVLDARNERVVHEYGAQPFFGPGYRRGRRARRR